MKNKIVFSMILALFIANHNTFAEDFLVSIDSTAKAEIELGEVIILASRDESKLKDIPTAITSISGSQIERNQINSLEDAAAFAPNFMMLDYGTKIMSPVYIRGIGSKKNSPSVGMYVDGIPYYDNSALSFDFYDLHSLEILRGPQGTLYGRNTIGGLININTLSPMDYQGTNIRLTEGQYDNYKASVSHYGKSGKLAYSVAGNYVYDGGYFTNNYDDSPADEMQSYGLRNRLIYQVNDKLSFENIFSFEQSKQSGYPYAKLDSTGKAGDINYNDESGYDRLLINEGIKGTYESDKWVANAIVSYQHIADKQTIDQDLSSIPNYIVNQDQKQNMYSFEGTIRSKGDDQLKWQAGAFAFKQGLDKVLDVVITPKNSGYIKDYEQSMKSAGLFFQTTYAITERLNITQGIRLNYESSVLDYKYDLTSGESINPVQDTAYKALDEFIVLPKLAVTYTLDEATIYASYNTGYKPGGYNSTFETEEQLQFENEMSHNFELGVKGNLFNDFIFADIALFHTNIKGQQFLRNIESETGTYIDNTGSSRNQGVEVSLSSRPIAGFSANIAYGYTKTEITSYVKNDSVNYDGNTSPFVPEHTLNITLNKSFQTKGIDFIDRINAQVNYQRIGEMYWNVENTLKEDAYGTLNAQVSFAYKGISLDIWGKNILDQYYNAYVFISMGSNYAQAGQPSRWGTTLSVKF